MKRRHTHVGAPDNRIKALYKEYVLTPRGRDMIPELGPVVTVSPQTSYHISEPWATWFLYWLEKEEGCWRKRTNERAAGVCLVLVPVLIPLAYIFIRICLVLRKKLKGRSRRRSKKRTALDERDTGRINVASLSMAFETSLNDVVFCWTDQQKRCTHIQRSLFNATANLGL